MASNFEHDMLENQKETNQLLRSLAGQSNRGSYGVGGSGGGGGGSSGGGFGDGIAGKAVGLTGKVVEGLDGLWRGTLNVSTGFDKLTSTLGLAGGKIGNELGKIANTFGHTLIDTNTALNTSLKHGMNLDNNLSEYDKLIKGARMTHEEYNDMIKKGAEEMSGLGSNINISQKNFLLMSKALQEGDVAAKLKEIGLHAEDLNEVMAASMANRRGMDMSDPAAKKAAVESAEKMLVATEEIARITGESRKDQLDAMRKHDEDAAVQMKISTLDKQAKERFDEGMIKMHQLGPAYEKLFRDSFLGMMTKEGGAAVAATGTAAADVQRYGIAAQRNDVSAAEREALGEKTVSRGLEWESSTGALNMGMYSRGAAADLRRQNWTEGSGLREATRAKMDEVQNQTGQAIDYETARKLTKEAVDNSMAQRNKDGSPNTNPDAEVAKTINKADRALSDMTSGSSVLFGKLNTELGTAVQKLGDLNKVLGPMTQAQAGEKLKNPGGFLSPDLLPDALAKANARDDQTKEKTTPAQMAAPVEAHHRASGSPSFENFLNGSGGFNDMFEKFSPAGEPAELHGEELVATRKQMEKFVEKIIPTPPMAQPNVKPAELPSLPPIDFKNVPAVPTQTDAKPADAATIANNESSKVLAQSLNIVADRLKELSSSLHDFKPLEHMNQVVDKVTAAQKPAPQPAPPVQPPVAPVATPKPAVSQHPELKKIADQINADKAKETKTEEKPVDVKKEEKPVEIKKEEPKVLDLGIKTAEDLNKFIFGGMPQPKEPPKEDKDKLMEQGKTAESFFKSNTEKVSEQMREQFNKMAPNPFNKIEVPKIDESAISKQLIQQRSNDPTMAAVSKHVEELGKSVSTSIATNKSTSTANDSSATLKPKAPDVSSLDSSLVNIAKFNKAMQSGDISKIGMAQMDLSDAGKAAEKKLGPSTASIALQKKREALENASFDYEEMKAANTKPSAESAEKLAKKKEEVAKLSLAYEEDLIKTKGRLNLHAAEEIKHAEVKNKNNEAEKAQQVVKALADEKKFMKEHGPASEDKAKAQIKTDLDKTVDNFNSTKFKLFDEDEASVRNRQKEQAKANDKSPGIFESISNFFTSSNKPAFASGNVKYEEIPQAEIDAKNKRMQESIGKIDNSPEAIAAQKAELARQADSGRYKQKEPEKPKIEEVKKSAETKEDAHVKEMYKKYGLETFKDYNARVSDEVKHSHAQIKNATENRKDLSPKDVAPPPPVAPKPVEQQPPVQPPKPEVHVTEKQITLKEIHDDLMQLNKAITEMVHHAQESVKVGHKQVNEIKKSSGSRW